MAKKKLKIKKPGSGKSWREWFSWGKRRESRSAQAERRAQFWRRTKIAALSIFLPLLPAGLVVGFFYMEKYVQAQRVAEPVMGSLMFVSAPDWAYSEAMKKKLAAAAGGGQFELKEGVAKTTAENLSKLPWLYNVNVRITTCNVLVGAAYRQPEAVVKSSKGQTYFVGLPVPGDPLIGANTDDNENTVFVLDYVEINKPPKIEITGFAETTKLASGAIWYASDVTAALKLIAALKGMDQKICPEKPLSDEIASIDISNFNGRKSASMPHIILNLKDGKTQVNWGAAMGRSTSFIEASDIEKLTTFYTYYQSMKKDLQNKSKYIELRFPQSGIPRPQ